MSEKIAKKQNNTLKDSSLDISSIVILNIKSLLSNYKILWLLSIFFVVGVMLPIIFIPYSLSGAAIFLLSIDAPLLVILGWSGYNIRRSTLFGNINTSGISKNNFYIAQALFTVLIANILSLLLWAVIFVLGESGALLQTWIWESGDYSAFNPLGYGAIINIVYVTNVSAMVSFATYFLINSVTNNIKTYYIFVVSLLVLGFIFTGSLNCYFGYYPGFKAYIPEYTTNGVEGVDWKYEGDILYVTKNYFDNTNQLNDVLYSMDKNRYTFHGNLFPTSIFVPTLFYPFYGIGQFSTNAVTSQGNQLYAFRISYEVVVVNSLENYSSIIQSFPLVTTGVNKWYSWYHISFNKDDLAWISVILQPYFTVLVYGVIGLFISKYRNK